MIHDIIDMGERAEKFADSLLLQRDDHEMHRLGVVCRDFSLAVAHALTALSKETRTRVEELAA
jgi:hypothetical protein